MTFRAAVQENHDDQLLCPGDAVQELVICPLSMPGTSSCYPRPPPNRRIAQNNPPHRHTTVPRCHSTAVPPTAPPPFDHNTVHLRTAASVTPRLAAVTCSRRRKAHAQVTTGALPRQTVATRTPPLFLVLVLVLFFWGAGLLGSRARSPGRPPARPRNPDAATPPSLCSDAALLPRAQEGLDHQRHFHRRAVLVCEPGLILRLKGCA